MVSLFLLLFMLFFYDLSILFLINSSEVYPPFLSLTYKMEMFEANREFVLAQCSKFMKETQTEFKKVINNSSRWSRYLLYIFHKPFVEPEPDIDIFMIFCAVYVIF
jgi:hypothetical protein